MEITGVRRRRKDLIQWRIRGFSGDFPGEKKIVSGEEEAAGFPFGSCRRQEKKICEEEDEPVEHGLVWLQRQIRQFRISSDCTEKELIALVGQFFWCDALVEKERSSGYLGKNWNWNCLRGKSFSIGSPEFDPVSHKRNLGLENCKWMELNAYLGRSWAVALQQLGGVNGIAYYTSAIFTSAEKPEQNPISFIDFCIRNMLGLLPPQVVILVAEQDLQVWTDFSPVMALSGVLFGVIMVAMDGGLELQWCKIGGYEGWIEVIGIVARGVGVKTSWGSKPIPSTLVLSISNPL
ncbi:hypothetical protein U1Q18_035522 [Sarracenia purpurea var. burkii]